MTLDILVPTGGVFTTYTNSGSTALLVGFVIGLLAPTCGTAVSVGRYMVTISNHIELHIVNLVYMPTYLSICMSPTYTSQDLTNRS